MNTLNGLDFDDLELDLSLLQSHYRNTDSLQKKLRAIVVFVHIVHLFVVVFAVYTPKWKIFT